MNTPKEATEVNRRIDKKQWHEYQTEPGENEEGKWWHGHGATVYKQVAARLIAQGFSVNEALELMGQLYDECASEYGA